MNSHSLVVRIKSSNPVVLVFFLPLLEAGHRFPKGALRTWDAPSGDSVGAHLSRVAHFIP